MAEIKTGIEILDINPAYRGDKIHVKNRKTKEVVAIHEVISWANVNYWISFSDEPAKMTLPCIRIDGEVKPYEAPAGHDLSYVPNPEQYLHVLNRNKAKES